VKLGFFNYFSVRGMGKKNIDAFLIKITKALISDFKCRGGLIKRQPWHLIAIYTPPKLVVEYDFRCFKELLLITQTYPTINLL